MKPEEILRQTNKIKKLSCSRDSEYLAFIIESGNDSQGNLFVINIKDKNILQITQENKTLIGVISPDGSKIAFINNSEGRYDLTIKDIRNNVIVYSISSSGEGIHLNNPVWSPDGGKVSFEEYNIHTQMLKMIELKKSKEEIITKQSQEKEAFPGYTASWSPDSQYLVYQVFLENGDSQFFIQDINSSQAELIPKDVSIHTSVINWVYPSP